MNIPEIYRTAIWDKVPEKIKETIRENPKKGLYIHGDVGTGKTFMAYGVAHRAQQKGMIARVYNFSELLRVIRESYGKHYQEYHDNPVYDIQDFDGLLIIDDLGAEKVSDWSQEMLYGIINRRYEEKLITIITSNLNIADLAERVGERIVSRIVEMCSIVEIKGEDKRFENAEKVVIEV